MKTFFVLLVVALLMAGGYWKMQHPDAGMDDLRQQGEMTLSRVMRGVDAVIANADPAEAIEAMNADPMAASTATGADEGSGESTLTTDNAPAAGENNVADPLADTDQNVEDSATTAFNKQVLERLYALELHNDTVAEAQEVASEAVAAESAAEPDAVSGAAVDTAPVDTAAVESALQDSATLNSLETLLVESLDAGQSRIDRQASALAALTTRLDTLETTLAEQGQTLADRTEVVDEADRFDEIINSTAERLDAIEMSQTALIKALSDSAEDASQRNTVAENTRQTIDLLQGEIREQLDGVQQQLADNTTNDEPDVAALTEALDTTRQRIADIEQRVATLPDNAADADDAEAFQSDLSAQLASIEARLAAETGEPDLALAESLAEVKDQLNQLTSQSFVTQEELSERTQARNVEYKVFFEFNSTEISDEAANLLDDFIDQEQDRAAAVSIFGLTDRLGPAEYNQALADRRARNVRSYLIQNGFDFTLIQAATGLGEDAAAGVLDDEEVDARQRAVVLFATQQ